MSGVTTMIGGGTGPAVGTAATTCTPGPWHLHSMLGAADAGFFIHPPDAIVAQFPQYPVNRSYAELKASIDNASLTIERAASLIERYYRQTSRRPSASEIFSMVAQRTAVPVESIRSRSRKASIVRARQMVVYLIRELLDAGLMHDDIATVVPGGMRAYCAEPRLVDGTLAYAPCAAESADTEVVRPVSAPFEAQGGLRLLRGCGLRRHLGSFRCRRGRGLCSCDAAGQNDRHRRRRRPDGARQAAGRGTGY